jgi:hypothetical protein
MADPKKCENPASSCLPAKGTISAVLIVRAQKERQKLSANVDTPRVAATPPKFSC